MKNFRTLDLAIELYQSSKPIKLRGAAKNQLERALLSICLNLSEGNSRLTLKERRRFFNIALGSLRESQLIIKLENISTLSKLADQCGGSLFKLIQAVQGA